MIKLRRAVLVTLTAITAGCHHRGTTQPSPAVIEQRVYTFMLCQECIGGELANVVALGGSAVPLLRSTLLTGPPPAHAASLKLLLSTPARAVSPPPDTASINLQVADFDAMYRVRAVAVLTAIGGSDATDALCAGKKKLGLRPRIYSKIDTALVRVGGTCP
jgi:hypothetical protein